MNDSPSQTPQAGGQTWSADHYEANARFVSHLGSGVLDWLNPKAGERILDLGCGDGVLTQSLVEAGARVLGVDSSAQLLASAAARGLDVQLIDGHDLAFNEEFEGAFSNAALHWMTRPELVIAGVHRALRPGGRFVGEFGGFGNVAAIATAMRAVGDAMGGDPSLASPWYFPSESEYGEQLKAGGFTVVRMLHFARPTPLPTDVRGWLETMRAEFFTQFGDQEDDAYRRVIAALEPSLKSASGQWYADYFRLRFHAEKSD